MIDQNRAAKRAIDLVLSVLGLLAASCFLFLVVAVLIKLDSPGPVFYRRRVVGVGGKEFDALKFRTMAVDAEDALRRDPRLWAEYQATAKLKNDPRVTRVGSWLRRLSLDELPQLFNVLWGEMSLVGPRMIAPEELRRYGTHASKLLTVQPGITGLWQVSGRQEVSYETRVGYDMAYIEGWSLALDLKILLKTIPAVLGMKGAY